MNKRSIKTLVAGLICAMSISLLTGCGKADPKEAQMDYSSNSVGIEARQTETNQKALDQNQPPPQITWSLERDNLIKRIKLWNDPNKISYVYLISFGKVMTQVVIKGKVSSVDSHLTTDYQIVKDPNSYYGDSLLLESPDFDGSYGTNGDAIFGFATDGMYFEWNGKYMLTDQPFNLLTAPELTRTTK